MDHVAYASTKRPELTQNYRKIYCNDAVGTFALGVRPQMTVDHDGTSVMTLKYHPRLLCQSAKMTLNYDKRP